MPPQVTHVTRQAGTGFRFSVRGIRPQRKQGGGGRPAR
ncbi:hypothetical protein T261_6158 [Streptomyces lydicus]|nr:hypothetical protein T261_6158 [Streptomyces lydicus]